MTSFAISFASTYLLGREPKDDNGLCCRHGEHCTYLWHIKKYCTVYLHWEWCKRWKLNWCQLASGYVVALSRAQSRVLHAMLQYLKMGSTWRMSWPCFPKLGSLSSWRILRFWYSPRIPFLRSHDVLARKKHIALTRKGTVVTSGCN